MKRLIKNIFRKFGLEISKYSHNIDNIHSTGFVSLMPIEKPRGNVLLSYIIDPFMLKSVDMISNSHHNHWLSWQIAKTFLDFGYGVDVVHYLNYTFTPEKDYSFFVGARTNFSRIARLLNKDCIKIVHLDVAHFLFHNWASYKRCLDLKERRGVAIASNRLQEPNWAIEDTDYATTNFGNQFNVSTFLYAGKPIIQIPLPTFTTYPWPEKKDFDTCRNHFLWFGSHGFVHKGLDLVLDAFAEMPECQLTVCGPVRPRDKQSVEGLLERDGDFEKAYFKELYHMPNINTVGWVDIESPEFIEITNKCIGNIYPSCSEGGGASVITCMQAGLIPIVSYESNVEVKDFGFTFSDCTVAEIKHVVQTISRLPATELEQMALRTWEYSRKYHTRERFAKNYQKVIQGIINCDLNSIVSETVLLNSL